MCNTPKASISKICMTVNPTIPKKKSWKKFWQILDLPVSAPIKIIVINPDDGMVKKYTLKNVKGKTKTVKFEINVAKLAEIV
jgi:hypothetical protein